ncbi:MAG TPA: MOSC N-terminal beta barrel domain-containing protein [Chthoniobacterales bacterium]
MSRIGTVESLWRYPVKSMRGEELPAVFAGFAGIYCDRLYAIHDAGGRKSFPFLTAREQHRMLSFQPRFREPAKSIAPPNLVEAENLPPGATPIYGDPADLALDVETPAGERLAIEDPALLELLRDGIDARHQLSLLRSERALTDCRPISIISLQSIAQLAAERGAPVDKLRFRSNIHLDLLDSNGFAEDGFVGRSLRIGERATFAILELDPRCAIVVLDPATGEKDPAILKTIAQRHGGNIGIYGAVLVEGLVRQGDPVELLD